ncbi:hypothetical protein RBSH_04904 [Rhodopirellula baltica SH28]|uniref:Uncharacterized protein n=1 Tax=Rhodopirellula baltica SH28 TaxID=993517 RepID=K5E238_RHOBT|nr:hypothetical protein [Rhodopirellula baltica]EKJ99820.1 hypothetical protein RBSH_04904 [Rhodopirellula baltica SH28]
MQDKDLFKQILGLSSLSAVPGERLVCERGRYQYVRALVFEVRATFNPSISALVAAF